ncbi:MAG: hypothetical protein KAR79_06180 [Simkaniaceae bacterium]|nr:hypothetical protein [Simkaniaceae bacterium]
MKLLGYCVILLLVGACSHQDSWQHTAIRSGISEHNFAKLSSTSRDLVNGFELEMISQKKDLNLYINIYTNTIHSRENKVKVTFNADHSTYECQADLLEGGQRIRFEKDQIAHIITHLLNNEETTIQLSHYEMTLNTHRFQKHLKKLTNTRFFSLPHEWIGLSY